MRDLTAFQRDCLYAIGGLGDPKGKAIKEALDDYYEKEVTYGRVYPNLDELADEDLISKGKKDDRSNEYRLTDEGVQTLEERREWEGKLSH